MLINTDKGNGLTFAACTTSAANAVHIVLGYIGQLLVYYMGKLGDI